MEPLWSADQTAAFIKKPKQYLIRARWEGKGPRALRVGRELRYRPEDVRAWLDELAAEDELRAKSKRAV